jgi:hypothetical protein
MINDKTLRKSSKACKDRSGSSSQDWDCGQLRNKANTKQSPRNADSLCATVGAILLDLLYRLIEVVELFSAAGKCDM